MNLVLDDAVEVISPTEQKRVGLLVVRGNSVLSLECLDKVT